MDGYVIVSVYVRYIVGVLFLGRKGGGQEGKKAKQGAKCFHISKESFIFVQKKAYE
jgi:hypothetical protein